MKVLFICLGNICRSPIAEEVFRQKTLLAGLDNQIQCDSAGTAGYHAGLLPDLRMRQLATQKGFTLTHKSRKLQVEDLTEFDYLMAMDEHNYNDIVELARSAGIPNIEEKLLLYRTFDPERGEEIIVPDPYYSGPEAFEEVYQIVDRAADQFLPFIREQLY